MAQTEQNEEEENSIEELIQEFPFSTRYIYRIKMKFSKHYLTGHVEDERIGNSLGYEIEYGITDKISDFCRLHL